MKILLRSMMICNHLDQKDSGEMILNFRDFLKSDLMLDHDDTEIFGVIRDLVEKDGVLPPYDLVFAACRVELHERLRHIQVAMTMDRKSFNTYLGMKEEKQNEANRRDELIKEAKVKGSGTAIAIKAETKQSQKSTKIGKPKFPEVAYTRGGIMPKPGSIKNTAKMLEHCGITIKYNVMSKELEIDVPPEPGVIVPASEKKSRAFSKIMQLGRDYDLSLSITVLNEHITLLQKAYHPVADWLNNLEPLKSTDNRDYLLEVLHTLNIVDQEDQEVMQLAYDLLLHWMITAYTAAMVPIDSNVGVAQQGVLILVGPGDVQKTRWFEHLVPNNDWFKDGAILDPKDKDTVIDCTNHWVTELGEMDATLKSDIPALKAFISSPVNTYRASYGRFVEQHARRTALCGSCNRVDMLLDTTGNRKYWPIHVISCDVIALKAIPLNKLWAQIKAAHSNGETGFLPSHVKEMLEKHNQKFEVGSPMVDMLMHKWQPDPTGASRVTLKEIREEIYPERIFTQQENALVTACLRHKWKLKETKIHGFTRWPVIKRTDANSLTNTSETNSNVVSDMLN